MVNLSQGQILELFCLRQVLPIALGHIPELVTGVFAFRNIDMLEVGFPELFIAIGELGGFSKILVSRGKGNDLLEVIVESITSLGVKEYPLLV